MTEEEKALAGYLYLAKEKELQKERERSQELSYEYNQLRPSQNDERVKFLKRELKKTGKISELSSRFTVISGKGLLLEKTFLLIIILQFLQEMKYLLGIM